MYAGKIVEQGTTREILRMPRHPYTQGLLNSRPDRFPAKAKLPQIRGSMPSLSNLPRGCAFASRCDRATDLCAMQSPAWQGDTQQGVRCFHPLEPNP